MVGIKTCPFPTQPAETLELPQVARSARHPSPAHSKLGVRVPPAAAQLPWPPPPWDTLPQTLPLLSTGAEGFYSRVAYDKTLMCRLTGYVTGLGLKLVNAAIVTNPARC